MRHRKRSAAITLVLAGSLSGCSEPETQRDVYTSLADCQRDWGQAQLCEPARDGRYSNTWFYGPAYFGEPFPSGRPRPMRGAVDSFHTGNRQALAAAPGAYWGERRDEAGGGSGSSSSRSFWRSSGPSSASSHPSSSSSSSSVSRGGFGSSARASGG